MRKAVLASFAPVTRIGLALSVLACSATVQEPPSDTDQPANTIVVGVTAQAGAVDGVDQNSDEFIWRQLAEFAAPVSEAPSPVLFETWASDADTFSFTPAWPEPGEEKDLQVSVQSRFSGTSHGPIDVPCKAPGNAAVGGFPLTGTPTPCIAEETKRNRPQFDYIVENGLNTQPGLKAAFDRGFTVAMPTSALSVKGDWVPIPTLLQWIPELGTAEKVRELYYTNTSGGVDYAVVSLHVSSRQNPNWVWGSFEHFKNPGRCDYIGCLDSFGAEKPVVRPNLDSPNSQYGPCLKTEPLKELMAAAGLSPVWQNYCLKSSMVDYSAADGTPYVLGNSVIEGITGNGTVAASSCMGCHVYASFGPEGAVRSSVVPMLPFNPTGPPNPQILEGSVQFDFMWGVLLAPAAPAKGDGSAGS